ncbi:MAG TPA: DeoR/GlpR family DNA-binding transcription regulator [Actinomycetes bacterium]|nr:DeoR/GlpR family DNA-binding transcription regulator [Actinomycetes bacterium]
MYAEERQQAIVARARAEGRVDVAGLAELLAVTPETVRRDLTSLERKGVLRRVHGGAIPVERLGLEPAVSVRETVLTAEKERIAKAALDELPEEGTIAIDAGTTTMRLVESLPLDRELTVVTNSLPHAMVLASRPNVTLHIVGGRVRPRTLASVDEAAQEFLRGIYVDVAFVGANGVSRARGLTTPDRSEAAVKQAFIASARRSVVLADHTKFGDDHFATFGQLSDIDAVVTDTGVEAELVEEIEAAGPRVVLA